MALTTPVFAQSDNNIVDSIIKRASYYRVKKPDALMFVHLDKTVYINNDVMWFTAYLLGVHHKDVPKHQVLSAALVNNNDQKIAAQGRFIMSTGMAYGSLTVPDSVPPGHYSFVAYTNRLLNGKPEISFVQSITIKTAADAAFNVELLLDTLYKDPANVRVLLKADAKTGPLDGASINYFLGKDSKTRLSGKAKTNVIGSYTLMLPKDRINATQHNLEVQVKSGSETKTLHLDIPVKQPLTDVKFYPEGGHLVLGMPNRVGWEVKTTAGTAIKVMAQLYAGNTLIDTIETDSFGMGIFYVNPMPNVNYTVKLLEDKNTGIVYTLPAAKDAGVLLRMADAVVKDTLKFQLLTKYPGKTTVLVHNYKHLYSATILESSPGSRNIKIDVKALPRGINTITVLDSLNRPCAERLFFAHYDQKPRVSISMENPAPGLRQKISVKLKLNSANGKPLKGVVSVACVQDNRFLVANDNNIEHYVYLQSELDNLPLKDDLLGKTEVDRRYINELLLVRGWSKYKWPELMQASATDTIKKTDSLLFSGSITRFNSILKKPVQLLLMKDSSGIGMFNSDSKGGFILNNNDVYTQADRKARLIVSGKSDEYVIQVTDPYLALNTTLAKDIDPVIFEEPITQTTKEFVLKGFEHATHLKEVKIVARNQTFRHGFGGANANACGDYVCRFNILNCPNHRTDIDNRAPRQGEMVNMPGQGIIRYAGCMDGTPQAGMTTFAGIYAAKEFYGADYKLSNPTEPDYLSTICWKSGISLSSEKEAEVSFYTSDITGKFRIVVQGITTNDVVYGEDSFTVQKKTP